MRGNLNLNNAKLMPKVIFASILENIFLNLGYKNMREALILVENQPAAIFTEKEYGKIYMISYKENYTGPSISLTLPVKNSPYTFEKFPSFFDGLLPEGPQLEGLLKRLKIDRDDFFSQLLAVGRDLVGAVNVVRMEK